MQTAVILIAALHGVLAASSVWRVLDMTVEFNPNMFCLPRRAGTSWSTKRSFAAYVLKQLALPEMLIIRDIKRQIDTGSPLPEFALQ